MTRRRIIVQAFLPVLAVWAVLLPIAYFLDADWPDGRLASLGSGEVGWQLFILGLLVISVFMLKARVALWNRRSRDWLALSFAYLDLSIAVFFMLLVGTPLWADERAEHARDYRIIYQAMVLNILIASVVFLYFFADAIVTGRFRDTVVPVPEVTSEESHE